MYLCLTSSTASMPWDLCTKRFSLPGSSFGTSLILLTHIAHYHLQLGIFECSLLYYLTPSLRFQILWGRNHGCLSGYTHNSQNKCSIITLDFIQFSSSAYLFWSLAWSTLGLSHFNIWITMLFPIPNNGWFAGPSLSQVRGRGQGATLPSWERRIHEADCSICSFWETSNWPADTSDITHYVL